ncbi:MAG: hypothetical protein NW220_00910 [Leptolyngbyaceae cyanobacterium bins.349]|nr:hypothetical protein [Leptolyngbyaceae cyanobacterium bins.349]
MHYPSFVVAVTAIALGSTSTVSAQTVSTQQVLWPPAALQSPVSEGVQTQIPAPSASLAGTANAASEIGSSTGSSTGSLISSQPATQPLETGATAATNAPATNAPDAIEPQRFSDTSLDAEIAAPATSLQGTVAADARSMATNCPLKTEMLALAPDQVAQAATGPCPRPAAIPPLMIPEPYQAEASPALSIYIPVGYGLDGWAVWGSGNYQAGVREDTGAVGGGGVGVGLGDARKYVGLELGYTFIDSDSFGEGGFSGKLHRRVGDNASIAFGWNGFANIGRNDFEHSIYGVATYIFRFSRSLDSAFSRLALTVGAGNGQFRSNLNRDQFENGTNVFGNLALRVIRPVSLIAEWTGQDLAVGLSIAPFRNFPFVITPAVRDVTGSGYEPRFVIGAGVSFKF